MNLSDHQRLEMLANEAFIRRAAELDLPFMLKGSYVTRQYFENLTDRTPNDLDWVYLETIPDVAAARKLFDDWVIQVTELTLNDGVVFQSFRKNAFWRMIDYAMADNFPTVSTDVECWVNGEHFEGLWIDISFNLPIEVPSELLLYRPLAGEPFLIAHTTPLVLQVAWKLHQTLVRPCFKDLFDLLHLLKNAGFTPEVRDQALEALRKECRADNTDVARLRWLLSGELDRLFAEDTVAKAWRQWRHPKPTSYGSEPYYDHAGRITDPAAIPATLPGFQQQISLAFQQAGFDAVLAQLPTPVASDKTRKALSPQKSDFFTRLRDLFN